MEDNYETLFGLDGKEVKKMEGLHLFRKGDHICMSIAGIGDARHFIVKSAFLSHSPPNTAWIVKLERRKIVKQKDNG